MVSAAINAKKLRTVDEIVEHVEWCYRTIGHSRQFPKVKELVCKEAERQLQRTGGRDERQDERRD